jgi:hypothetical protein
MLEMEEEEDMGVVEEKGDMVVEEEEEYIKDWMTKIISV